MENDREKFQNLVRRLFQFDSADLDFGIYRIMNFKRDVIEKFIQKDLLDAVDAELKKGSLAEQSETTRLLEEKKHALKETHGEDALDGEGYLKKEYQSTKVGQEYLKLMDEVGVWNTRPALEATIFNHLYTFFSRYYDAGDFMSKRRYSKKEKYAIPYNGEEVYLHWANSDQYYIKTTENFTSYSFKSGDVSVHFKIQQADVEKDNVKGNKRFFIPLSKQATYDANEREIVIPFEYRPLTQQEEITHGKKSQQDSIIAQTVQDLPEQFKKETKALQALMAERRKSSDGEPVSFLAHHLRRYSRRNTSDYFIHKDLKGFLQRELDFYLKNEVLNLDELEAGGEARAEGWFQTMRVIKAIGRTIIEFLAQIENFQKKLFEKRKFITETGYCITVGNIQEDLYDEIADSEAQWQEWRELFHIDEDERDLFTSAMSKKERRVAFLKGHPTLVLDTRHFEQAFIDRLLASYSDLDEMCDGLLVHSENFQALNLLVEKYRNEVKCIYVDPPYNTGKDGFPYKDQYQHSSWLSMILPRTLLSFEFLRADGVFFASIDRNEFSRLALGYERTLPSMIQLGELVWHNARDNNPTQVAIEHEYILCLGRSAAVKSTPWKSPFSDAKDMILQLYNECKANGLEPHQIQRELRAFIKSNKELLGEVERYKHVDEKGIFTGSESVHNPHPGGYEYEILHPDTKRPMRKPVNGYRFPESTMRCKFIEKGRLIYGADENRIVKIKLYLDEYQDSLRSTVTIDGRLGAYSIRNLFAQDETLFPNPKPVQLVQRLFGFIDGGNACILDFFAGSGTTAHAILNLNRFSRRHLRFILIEMGEYFDTVLLPRIKKVTFTPEWKDGKPKRQATAEEAQRSPRIIKYLRLEGYEDALNNISLQSATSQKLLEFDDYLLKYLLDWESKVSETLLNVEKLSRPFSYKLKITEDQQNIEKPVDLPETFNYLLGLHVKTRRVVYDDKRRYLVYRGAVDHREVVVIWRETEGWQKRDYERDKTFVEAQNLADGTEEIFVNCDGCIPGATPLDPLFKQRMFGCL